MSQTFNPAIQVPYSKILTSVVHPDIREGIVFSTVPRHVLIFELLMDDFPLGQQEQQALRKTLVKPNVVAWPGCECLCRPFGDTSAICAGYFVSHPGGSVKIQVWDMSDM